MKLDKNDPAAGLTVKCYYCREPIALRKMPGHNGEPFPRVWYTVDHICMSETAKAKRFPQLDEELERLRAFKDSHERS